MNHREDGLMPINSKKPTLRKINASPNNEPHDTPSNKSERLTSNSFSFPEEERKFDPKMLNALGNVVSELPTEANRPFPPNVRIINSSPNYEPRETTQALLQLLHDKLRNSPSNKPVRLTCNSFSSPEEEKEASLKIQSLTFYIKKLIGFLR